MCFCVLVIVGRSGGLRPFLTSEQVKRRKRETNNNKGLVEKMMVVVRPLRLLLRHQVVSVRLLSSRGGFGGGFDDDDSMRNHKPIKLTTSNDWLKHGIKIIDNVDGKAIKKLPKDQELNVDDARDEFAERAEALGGAPYTIVYRPPKVHDLPPPEPRKIEELVAYVENTQFVDMDRVEALPEEMQGAVHQGWHALARNPYYREHEKQLMMGKMVKWLESAKDQKLLQDMMSLPDDDTSTEFDAEAFKKKHNLPDWWPHRKPHASRDKKRTKQNWPLGPHDPYTA